MDLNATEREFYSFLTFEERRVFDELGMRERGEFFEINAREERSDYLARKSLEMKNQTMESIERQGGKIAERSAEVLKIGMGRPIRNFCQYYISGRDSDLSLLFFKFEPKLFRRFGSRIEFSLRIPSGGYYLFDP